MVVVEMGFNQVRFRVNVVVDEENRFTLGIPNADVSCACGSTCGLRKHSQIAINFRFLVQDGQGMVRGIVVDHQNFELIFGDGLVLDPIYGTGQQIGSI